MPLNKDLWLFKNNFDAKKATQLSWMSNLDGDQNGSDQSNKLNVTSWEPGLKI